MRSRPAGARRRSGHAGARRVALLLLVWAIPGCGASLRAAPKWWPARWQPEPSERVVNVAEECPYRSLRVSTSTDRSRQNWFDRRLTRRAEVAFEREMVAQGFRLVEDERPYWLAHTFAKHNDRGRDTFIWLEHTQALDDLQGRHHLSRRVAGGPMHTGVVSNYQIFQWPLAALDKAAAKMANNTAIALMPHVVVMCDEWAKISPTEAARRERIRQELVDEIERVRAMRKELEIRLDQIDAR